MIRDEIFSTFAGRFILHALPESMLRQLECSLAAGDYKSIAEAAACIHVAVVHPAAIALYRVRAGCPGVRAAPCPGPVDHAAGRGPAQADARRVDQTAGLYGIVSDAQSTFGAPARGMLTTLAAMVTPELCQGFFSGAIHRSR